MSCWANYPIIGHLHYFLENQGEFFRQYFIADERDEMPFNRAAKDIGGSIGFGSTNNLCNPGLMVFVYSAFPVLEQDLAATLPLGLEGSIASPGFLPKSKMLLYLA